MNSVTYPFWDDLTRKEQKMVEESLQTRVFTRGSLIKQPMEACQGLMALESGSLRAFIMSEEGREVTLFRVFGGEVCVLSASCLMDSIEFELCIEALEDTKVQVLPLLVLNRIMQENLKVELYMYKAATEKFSEVMWTMQQILFKKIDERVAAFLWEEQLRSKTMTLSLTHEDVARQIGSAREVVTKVLKYMAEQGLLELKRGRITILDAEGIKQLV